MDDQYGQADRDQYNASNSTFNIHYNYGSATSPAPDEPTEDEPPEPAAAGGSGWGFIPIVIVFVLVGWIAQSFFPGPPDLNAFPAKDDAWPAGVTRDVLLAPVLASWRSCMQAVVLAPANCPQSTASSQGDKPDTVHWVLHGDPLDGALVRYRTQDHLFHVLGSAVITVTYRSGAGPGFASLSMYYWARVSWSDGKATVPDLIRYDEGEARWTISKRDPGIPPETLKPPVAQGFQRCFAAGTMPMPGECPNPSGDAGQNKATWTPLGDPLVNAKPHFESKFGLIHVIGSYSARVRYDGWFAQQSEVQGGNYDATLSVDDGKPVLLQIEASS
jgi:hypothetical protein